MSSYLWQGIQIGLGLAILVGPLIVLLVQLSLEEGTLSSLCAGFGIWASDLLYILLVHFGLGQLRALIDHPSFEPVVGSLGGLILVAVGVGMWLRRPPKFRDPRAGRRPRYFWSFWKGFAINFFNPFPVFFWSAVSVGIVYEEELTTAQTLTLYAAILGTIILTDTLKIGAARYLRRWLTPQYAQVVQRAGGGLLMVFGLVLWFRAWW